MTKRRAFRCVAASWILVMALLPVQAFANDDELEPENIKCEGSWPHHYKKQGVRWGKTFYSKCEKILNNDGPPGFKALKDAILEQRDKIAEKLVAKEGSPAFVNNVIFSKAIEKAVKKNKSRAQPYTDRGYSKDIREAVDHLASLDAKIEKEIESFRGQISADLKRYDDLVECRRSKSNIAYYKTKSNYCCKQGSDKCQRFGDTDFTAPCVVTEPAPGAGVVADAAGDAQAVADKVGGGGRDDSNPVDPAGDKAAGESPAESDAQAGTKVVLVDGEQPKVGAPVPLRGRPLASKADDADARVRDEKEPAGSSGGADKGSADQRSAPRHRESDVAGNDSEPLSETQLNRIPPYQPSAFTKHQKAKDLAKEYAMGMHPPDKYPKLKNFVTAFKSYQKALLTFNTYEQRPALVRAMGTDKEQMAQKQFDEKKAVLDEQAERLRALYGEMLDAKNENGEPDNRYRFLLTEPSKN